MDSCEIVALSAEEVGVIFLQEFSFFVVFDLVCEPCFESTWILDIYRNDIHLLDHELSVFAFLTGHGTKKLSVEKFLDYRFLMHEI